MHLASHQPLHVAFCLQKAKATLILSVQSSLLQLGDSSMQQVNWVDLRRTLVQVMDRNNVRYRLPALEPIIVMADAILPS